jgi:mannosyltransferase
LKNNLLKNKYTYILLILIAIGVFLRFYHMNFNSVWLDEVATNDFAKKPLLGIWNATVQGEYNPPLFYWLEHGLLYFGKGEFILRLIPALAGVATIPIVYLIGKEIGDRNVGIIGAALMTISPFHIYFSQEARTYSLVTLFVALAFLFFLKGLNQRQTWPWIYFGILSALAFWSHFIVLIPIIILFFLGFIFSWFKFNNVKNVVYGLAIYLIVSLPLLIVMVRLFFIRIAIPISWGAQGLSLIYSILYSFSEQRIYIIPVFFMLFCLGMIMLFRENKEKFSLLIILFILSLVVCTAISYKIDMGPNYLIFLLPFYFVGIAYIVRFSLFKSKYFLIGFLLIILISSMPKNIQYYTHFTNPDWRGAGSYLKDMAKTQDLIIIIPGMDKPVLDFYYSDGLENDKEYEANTIEDLLQIQSSFSNGSIYYVVAEYNLQSENELVNWLKNNAGIMKSFYGEIELYKK